jgi:predicted lysophospholipase L1 biosynthesis ABC-type transport system permease subunit
MNKSTFESMSRVLLAIAIAVLAGVLAFGGNRDAIAQSRTARCESAGTMKGLAPAMDSILAAGKTEFVTVSTAGGAWVCGW